MEKETSAFSDFINDGKEPGTIMSYKWNHTATAYYDIMHYSLDKEEVIWLIQRLMTKYSLGMEDIATETK